MSHFDHMDQKSLPWPPSVLINVMEGPTLKPKESIFVTTLLLTLNKNVVCHKNQWYHGVSGMILNVLNVADKWFEDVSIHVNHYGLLKNNSLLVKQNQLCNSVIGQSAHVNAGRIHLL